MAAKKGKKGRKKGKKKDVVASFKKKASKIVRGNKRPVAFLKKMAAKMERNLPKLKAIIAKNGSDGRPLT